jgi:hypothetical protein
MARPKASRYLSKVEMLRLIQSDAPNGEIMDVQEIGLNENVPVLQVALSRDVTKAEDHDWLDTDMTTWRIHTFIDGKRSTSIIVTP